MVGVPASDPLAATAAARFKVLARPFGRVALQCVADNRVVGVTGAGADSRVVLGPHATTTRSRFSGRKCRAATCSCCP